MSADTAAPLPAATQGAGASFRFGAWELHPDERRLLYLGREVALGGRAFDLLCCLARHRPAVVSQADLMDAAWPGEAVDPNNLQVQILALRRLLGRQAVATIPRRGYRLVAERAGRPDEAAADRHAPTPLDDQLHRHALLTVVGAPDAVLEGQATRAARRYVDAAGVTLWIVDAPELSRPGASLATLLRRAAGRADLVLLKQAHLAGPGVSEGVHEMRRSAPALRWLLTAAAPLGLDGERVIDLSSRAAAPDGRAAATLRWQPR